MKTLKLKKGKKRKKEDNPQICSVEPYWRNSAQAVPTLLGRLAQGPYKPHLYPHAYHHPHPPPHHPHHHTILIPGS